MKTPRSVLLVHNEHHAFRGLEEMMHEQEIRTAHTHQCAEVGRLLNDAGPIDLVLTDTSLPDGTWKDVIRMVYESAKDMPVIVMSRVVSMKLYLDTQDAGAADFIVPPMAPRDLVHVLAAAMHRNARPSAGRGAAPGRRDQRRQSGARLERGAS